MCVPACGLFCSSSHKDALAQVWSTRRNSFLCSLVWARRHLRAMITNTHQIFMCAQVQLLKKISNGTMFVWAVRRSLTYNMHWWMLFLWWLTLRFTLFFGNSVIVLCPNLLTLQIALQFEFESNRHCHRHRAKKNILPASNPHEQCHWIFVSCQLAKRLQKEVKENSVKECTHRRRLRPCVRQSLA